MIPKILVVEDEPTISRLIEFNLQRCGFEVRCEFDGMAVFEAVREFSPHVIILDLMLPSLDGLQVCRRLRMQNVFTPVIILSALQELSDKVAGLDNGADDYMSKPFSPAELIARIQSILRRNRWFQAPNETDPIRVGQISIHPDKREVAVEGSLIDLTPKEFELLLYLGSNKGNVLKRDRLLEDVWGYQVSEDTRIIDVHISHLRDKIEKDPKNPEYILTIRNVGYKMRG